MTKDELISKIMSRERAPFLFLGSGFSRHYINTPDWKGLLEQFSPKYINEYYSKANTTSLPTIAGLIAIDLTQQFWSRPDNDEEKQKYKDRITDPSIYLKLKIAEFLGEKSKENFADGYAEEIELLKKLCIDGIITTNWDDTAERMFPEFKSYIGQQELLFAPTFSIGEIYKIHGCLSQPSSMILTDEDYQNFNNKNAYLAAKLITIFIEHPVVFMGYSMSDSNIMELLKSIVNCLDGNNIDKLRDNLFFVEWKQSDDDIFKINESVLQLNNNTQLPVVRIETNNYKPIYECLSKYERKIPANLLREYKKQFYDIIVSEKPERKLYVLSDDRIDDSSNIQFVYGFGAINKYKSAIGYVGITATDILQDVLNDRSEYDAERLLSQSIPNLMKNSFYLPVYRYLSELPKVESKKHIQKLKLPTLKELQSYHFNDALKKQSLTNVVSSNMDAWKKAALIPHLNINDSELDDLRLFIKSIFNLVDRKHFTYIRKVICFYDMKRYRK